MNTTCTFILNTKQCCRNGSLLSGLASKLKSTVCNLPLWAKQQGYQFTGKTLLTAWSSLTASGVFAIVQISPLKRQRGERQTTIRAKSCWTASLFFSFIHPFTVLILIFLPIFRWNRYPDSCIQMQFSLPTPCFNVALNIGVRASTMSINIENGEPGNSLVITPQWSNTFGPDCSLKAALVFPQWECES